MMKRLVLFSLVLLPTIAGATNPCFFGMRYFARYHAVCGRVDYFGSNKAKECDGVSYDLEQDGTVNIGFYLESIGNIYFVGVQKEPGKPNMENNQFRTSRIEILDKKGKTKKIPANGECLLLRRADGKTSFSCHAISVHGQVAIQVTTTAEPPEIEDCAEQLND